MSPHRTIRLAGWGAVSPAGWSAADLAAAVLDSHAIATLTEQRSADAPATQVRRVPAVSSPPAWLTLPRLRRTSPITRFAVSAALEALGPQRPTHDSNSQSQAAAATPSHPPSSSLGLIFVVQNGSVNFSRRFFAEALENPALASPILFPETVFNAPSSHLASLLAAPTLNNTLVSDSAGFLNALEMAAEWLDQGRASDVLVVSAEEHDWLSAEALSLFPGQKNASEGAAAVWLSTTPEPRPGDIVLEQLTDSFTISHLCPRSTAIQRLAAQLAAPRSAPRVCSDSASAAWDRPSTATFADWQGPRLSLQSVLGHPYSVLGGWQCVVACELLARGLDSDVAIVADSGATQAQAAWFHRLP